MSTNLPDVLLWKTALPDPVRRQLEARQTDTRRTARSEPTYLLGPSPLSNRKRSHARLISRSEIGRSRLRGLRIRLTGRAEMLISTLLDRNQSKHIDSYGNKLRFLFIKIMKCTAATIWLNI